MLHARSLPSKIWAEELKCANYIHKISPHRYIKENTSFEAWSNSKLEVTHFRIFVSCVWARIPSKKRKTLDFQITTCIFVGYPDGVKGYMLIDPSKEKLIIE
jgi:hypothetical protein